MHTTAADSSLVSGSSSTDAGDHVAGMTWEIIDQRRLRPYFDGARSKSNHVDGLSRGLLEGPWRGVERVDFPSREPEMRASE